MGESGIDVYGRGSTRNAESRTKDGRLMARMKGYEDPAMV